MLLKIFIQCAAAASFLYTAMYAVISIHYQRSNHITGLQKDVFGDATGKTNNT